KLLLVSLLDNFCLLYDQSPERNRKLFYVICKTLSNMGIIDEEYLEEMSTVRSSYQRAFRSLSYSDSFSSKGIIPSATMSFGDMFDNDPTRYKHDFVEICKLGKGGFASVFKARNKLDGIEYAIKKIRLRGSAKMRYEKIFREIKFLARLDHKNVIRYYSSWLEHADYPLPQRKMYDGGELDTNGEFDDEYDDEQLIARDLTLFIQMQLCQTTLQDYLVYRNERSQTYHEDLVDPAANQHIFRAIVEGVAYIHDQDMIHRDLKPSNIFLGMPATLEHQRAQQLRQDQCGQDSLSLGSNGSNHMGTLAMLSGNESQHDFPAALLSNDPSQPPLTKEQNQEELFMNIESMIPKIVTSGSGSSRTRTTAVGTVTYASPEQLARPNLGYDQKADIYSLGIIFFELYHPFSTLMERHAVLRTLRTGELPPEFVSRWPKEAAFVLWLMAEDPQLRPTAREI
ncbi:kinase-like domain-containing protein, partial [Gamsiella multidivaricata]|uniref:kinase-like domain-containing protein n=1 Tax=Gamsiella multidivaricata TaxID=101098 RepID=UPI00221EE1B0